MKTFEEWWVTWRIENPKDIAGFCAKAAWDFRDQEAAALQRQLEPSPCGHRNADRVDNSHIEHESTSAGEMRTLIDEGHCAACHREQEIRREERECVIELIKCCHGIGSCLNEASLIVKIRALPERDGGKDRK